MTTEIEKCVCTNSIYNIDEAGDIVPINFPVTGVNFFNRTTNAIAMQRLRMRGTVFPTGNPSGFNDFFRLLVVYDSQPNGAIPALSDILQDVDATGAALNVAFASLNFNNRDRFVIVLDDCRSLCSTSGNLIGSTSEKSYMIDEEIDLQNLGTMYQAHAGSAADIATGALFIVTVGTFTAGTGPWQTEIGTRVDFIDG